VLSFKPFSIYRLFHNNKIQMKWQTSKSYSGFTMLRSESSCVLAQASFIFLSTRLCSCIHSAESSPPAFFYCCARHFDSWAALRSFAGTRHSLYLRYATLGPALCVYRSSRRFPNRPSQKHSQLSSVVPPPSSFGGLKRKDIILQKMKLKN